VASGVSVAGIVEATDPAEFAAGRLLFEQYAGQLGVDLHFQDFESELSQMQTMYGPPSGCLLLARRDDAFVACAALRQKSGTICEMKRLYVAEEGRGAGLGRRLANALIGKASLLGYSTMVLDTLPGMSAAQALYRSLGFRERSAYYYNPVPGVVYMELDL
jgi:putative acetyltransferase